MKRERKQNVQMQTLPEIPVKPARAKRVLTPEQRQVLLDRLELARTARKANLAQAKLAQVNLAQAKDVAEATLPEL